MAGNTRSRAGGDWGEPIVRSPGKLISQALQRQGFMPSHEFIVRFIERLRDRDECFDLRAFGEMFYNARHFMQKGSIHKPRIAFVKGIPILYRLSSDDHKRIDLLGVLPAHVSPPVVPVRAPSREPNASYELVAHQRLIPPWELVTRRTVAPQDLGSASSYRGVTPATRRWAREVYARQLAAINKRRAELNKERAAQGLPALPPLAPKRVHVAHVNPLQLTLPGEIARVRPQEGRPNQSEGRHIADVARRRRAAGLFARKKMKP